LLFFLPRQAGELGVQRMLRVQERLLAMQHRQQRADGGALAGGMKGSVGDIVGGGLEVEGTGPAGP
jgi:hypothetical protein